MNDLANAPEMNTSGRGFMGAEIRWGMWRSRRKIGNLSYAFAVMLVLAMPAVAQLQVGDYLHMNLSGNVGYSYGGGFDQGQSSHSMGFTGNGFLTGDYYSPNFLNFNITPYYFRDQSNSIYGNLSNTDGVSSSVNLFAGSHFPGSLSYSRSFNGISTFGVPGSDLGLAQNTNLSTFSVGWSALLPNLPTLMANYSINKSDNTVLDEPGNDTENDRTFSLSSTYRWDGFAIAGRFVHRNQNADFSQFLEAGELPINSLSSSNSYNASLQHALPFTGSFGLSWNRLSYDYNYRDSYTASNSGTSDTINGNASFHPTQKLGIGFNSTYSDNLMGAIPEKALNGGTPIIIAGGNTFHSFLVGTDVFYQILKNLGVHADVSHVEQSFLGQSYSATQFGGSANFNFDHNILKGLSFSVGVVDTAQQQYNTGLGFVGNLNYTRKWLGFDLGGNFSYSQNVQTVMLVYTTSYYSYLGSIRRNLGNRRYLMMGYSGSHSGITANSGTTSSAERIFANFIFHGNSVNAYYNKSDGQAILTASGLVPIPTTLPGQVIAPNDFTFYNSRGYGGSVATTWRRWILSGAYGRSLGSTIDPLLSIYTHNTLINATMQYRFRKIYLNGGYTRLDQSIGAPGTPPLNVSTYFIGFSRWFNFF